MDTYATYRLNELDFAWLEQLVRQAGRIALRHFRRTTIRRKEDNTIVTDADGEIEHFLRDALASAYPHDTFLGEEMSAQTGASGRAWAIDPIDGTAAYASGLPVWAVSVGVLVNGEPVAGAVYLPLVDEYYSSDGRIARLNGAPIHVDDSGQICDETLLCVTSEAHRHYRIEFGGKTRAFGSSAAHICYVARGAAVAAVLGHQALWDIAGALPILRAAGGDLVCLPGGESPSGIAAWVNGRKSPYPLLAGAPWAVPYFLDRITLLYHPRRPKES
ncbi:MAG: inositol monophosphatase family protein [Anaerolineae bacterium]